MENNLENKAKFFAQYYLQSVMRCYGWDKDFPCCIADPKLTDKNFYLQLRPLSSITDEEAIEVAKQNKFTANTDPAICAKVGRDILKRVFDGSTPDMCLPFESADYLRSKSFALPYNDLTIEQQIEYGWIKLTDHEA